MCCQILWHVSSFSVASCLAPWVSWDNPQPHSCPVMDEPLWMDGWMEIWRGQYRCPVLSQSRSFQNDKWEELMQQVSTVLTDTEACRWQSCLESCPACQGNRNASVKGFLRSVPAGAIEQRSTPKCSGELTSVLHRGPAGSSDCLMKASFSSDWMTSVRSPWEPCKWQRWPRAGITALAFPQSDCL